jgi:hypothetical protein
MKSDEICINCIGDLAVEKNLYITMMDYQDSVIFGVYDIENDLNGGEYVFFYANKYK